MEKIFQEFLKKHGIEDYEGREYDNKLEFSRFKPKTWINGRFIWGKQPEGMEFWERLDNKWLKICKEQEGR